MQHPTFLTFSLRTDATEPIEMVAARVGDGLGCTLKRGAYFGGLAMVSELLGMQIGLLLWRGIGGAHIFQLHGMPDCDVVRGLDWEEIRIDRAIIDLLRMRGAGEWRQPSVEENLAEAQYDEDDI